uniref:Fructose-1-6-bisphosphatase class I N-terminal domain-containing protein n=1 Tax=Megaselia scalaris TaxID=36166 RepID=T1GZK6_MEGSC
EVVFLAGDVQGEEVKKLDVFSNELFINILKSSYTACLMVSEENENVIEVETERQGKYVFCFDPSNQEKKSLLMIMLFMEHNSYSYYLKVGSTDSHTILLRFTLAEPNMRVPDKGKIYSINEGYSSTWDARGETAGFKILGICMEF